MRFWTVSYIAINDPTLAALYYSGVALILLYSLWSLVFHHGYLEYEQVQGVCRPSLTGPMPSSSWGYWDKPHCGEQVTGLCLSAPVEEVALEPTNGRILVATHVHEALEKCEDAFCRHPTDLVKASDFYVADIGDHMLAITCNAQSFRFFSEGCHSSQPRTEKLRGAPRFRGTNNSSRFTTYCPYAASNRRIHGRVLGPNGLVLKKIAPGSSDAFPIDFWLRAAGTKLDDLSDDPEAPSNATLRGAGLVLLVTIAYNNHAPELTMFDHLGTGTAGSIAAEMSYDIEVRRVAEAGYHARRATVHQDANKTGSSMREVHDTHGILFQIEVSGRVGRFSWQALADQLVLKLGWLTLLQLALDIFWQYVLPKLGNDYNNQVYRWRVGRAAQVDPKLV